jgi:hypothetical protein
MGAIAVRWWLQLGLNADVGAQRGRKEGTTRRDGLGVADAERAMISPLQTLPHIHYTNCYHYPRCIHIAHRSAFIPRKSR